MFVAAAVVDDDDYDGAVAPGILPGKGFPTTMGIPSSAELRMGLNWSLDEKVSLTVGVRRNDIDRGNSTDPPTRIPEMPVAHRMMIWVIVCRETCISEMLTTRDVKFQEIVQLSPT